MPVLQLPLEAAGALPGADQGEADPRCGDNLKETGASSGGVRGETGVEVGRPP